MMITCTLFPYLSLSPRFVHCSIFSLLTDSSIFFQTWAKLYGWRPFSPLECYVSNTHHVGLDYSLILDPQANYVFWAEIGRRMGMQDVPESLEEMKVWSAVCTSAQTL